MPLRLERNSRALGHLMSARLSPSTATHLRPIHNAIASIPNAFAQRSHTSIFHEWHSQGEVRARWRCPATLATQNNGHICSSSLGIPPRTEVFVPLLTRRARDIDPDQSTPITYILNTSYWGAFFDELESSPSASCERSTAAFQRWKNCNLAAQSRFTSRKKEEFK
jgi:hypothetical protein